QGNEGADRPSPLRRRGRSTMLPVDADTPEGCGLGHPPQEPTALPRWRILVVDDNQDTADSLALLLRLLGHDVQTAYDGLGAVGGGGALQPALALLDIELPKLNGYEAARRIRQQGGRGALLVALTGWGQEEDRRRSREAGFDHHLIKPIEFEDLRRL